MGLLSVNYYSFASKSTGTRADYQIVKEQVAPYPHVVCSRHLERTDDLFCQLGPFSHDKSRGEFPAYRSFAQESTL